MAKIEISSFTCNNITNFLSLRQQNACFLQGLRIKIQNHSILYYRTDRANSSYRTLAFIV